MLAQNINIGGQSISGPLENINTVGDLINRLLSFLMPLAAIILLLVLIWGGYGFLMSGGQAEKIKSAQAKITTGLIGFFILIFAYLIVKIIAFVFGINSGIL